MPGFVYSLTDPRYDDEDRYIGKTINPVHKRLYSHIYEARRKPDSHHPRVRWVKKLLDLGMEPGIRVIEQNESWDDAAAYEHEAFWVSYFKFRFGHRILNVAPGGDHTVWATTEWTPEMRAHMSRKQREHYALYGSNQGEPKCIEARKAGIAALWSDPERAETARANYSRASKERWAALSAEERSARCTADMRQAMSDFQRARFADPEARAAQSAAVKAGMTPQIVSARNQKNREVRAQQRGYSQPPKNWDRPCVVCSAPLSNTPRWQTRSCPPCKNQMLSLVRTKKIESKSEYEARVLREWNR